jgi:hypothetical protein
MMPIVYGLLSVVTMQDSLQPASQMDGAALARRMTAEVPGARSALNDCYQSNVLRLGSANTETAETLLKGMRTICATQRARLHELYVPDIQGQAVVDRVVAIDTDNAESVAIAALLEARAARTRP